jgi:hypothetical protein
MINVTCPLCREVYHADSVHVGKHIRCSRCGSVVPIREQASSAVRRQYQASVVKPASPAHYSRRPRLRFAGWTIAVASIGLIASGLIWSFRSTDYTL